MTLIIATILAVRTVGSAPNALSMPPPRRPAVLERLGSWCARRWPIVLVLWLLAIAALQVGAHQAGGLYSDNVTVGGTEAATGAALLSRHDPTAGGAVGLVVLRSTHGPLSGDVKAIDTVAASLGRLPKVIAVSNPFTVVPPAVSSDGTIGELSVHLSTAPKLLGTGYVVGLNEATAPLRSAGLEVEYGGDFDQITNPSSSDRRSELVGFAVALVVLAATFGSLLAAVLPLLSALAAVLAGVAILGLVASVINFGTASPTLALMIGLGVGIDYALFLTTRFRQLVSDGTPVALAAGRAATTSGRAVLFAAGTVSVALLGLYASGMTFIGQLGFAAVFGVVTGAAGAVTLVPAALGALGTRIDRFHVRTPVAETGRDGDVWHRWAALVARHPWRFLLAGLGVLGVLAIPLFSIQLGHVDAGANPSSYTSKRAYDLVARGYGPGANAPFTVVVRLAARGTPASTLARELQPALAATPDVARAGVLQATADGALLVGSLTPASAPQARETTTLFNTLVDVTLPKALAHTGATGYIAGSAASEIEFASTISGRLWIIVAIVVVTAFLLVMTAFRSLLLALKAAVLNLLGIGAAYGVVVAVFQWGWGRSLVGVSENVPVESYVPVIMFAIVFGLSMDYEIFLLTRVKEAWDEGRDARFAVARGLSSTARVISCAALIMASVFTAFVASTNVVVKMLAVGLAASVLIDATVIRLLLVPAVMNLLGARSWWIPRWLDRVLPHLEVERSE